MKEFAKALWTNHKRKIISFLIGALLAAVYAATGVKLELKDSAPVDPPKVEAPVETVALPEAKK